mmetsp:Transcript_3283/g.5756  ORF Transcript_3283/g.5756 Transcript_3283/m.5756 type:complete len:214 (-) Transcript_3283:294-935(-)
MDERVVISIQKLHSSNVKLVYEFAGVGAAALFWLHSVPGSSNTIVEARDVYSRAALRHAMSELPSQLNAESVLNEDGASAPSVCSFLACHALLRCEFLIQREPDSSGGIASGVACLGAIATTNRIRRGSDKACICVAVREPSSTCFSVRILQIEFNRENSRSREVQENLVSKAVVCLIEKLVGSIEPHSEYDLGFDAADRLTERWTRVSASCF